MKRLLLGWPLLVLAVLWQGPVSGQEKMPRDRTAPAEPPPSRAVVATPSVTYVSTPVVCYYAAPSYWTSAWCGYGWWGVPVVSYYWTPVYSHAPVIYGQAAAPPVSVAQREPARSTIATVKYQPPSRSQMPADAPGLYRRAVEAYRLRDHATALVLIEGAVQLDGYDARYWYYKALAEHATGREAAARQSARRGAALELLGGADPTQSLNALEDASGADRKYLREARDFSMTRDVARRVLAEPVGRQPATEIAEASARGLR